MQRTDTRPEGHTDPPSKTVEDYLLNIYTLSGEGRPVIAARLAEALAVAPPTVTATLHRMARDGFITVSPQKEVGLTAEGNAMAETMVRRHRLAERLFTDSLAMDSESEIEQQACKFEHILSPEATDKICTFLGHPRTCPHGAPIPPGPCCGRAAGFDRGLVTESTPAR